MDLRFPRPLRLGDRIGVTSPSSGVEGAGAQRIEFAVGMLRERGFEVEVGDCMDGSSHISAPREQRAAELMRMLLDPSIRAVVPPWGGVTAIDLVDLLDYDALAAAEPTWIVGYSDSTTWMLPITLLSGWVTVHGDNLADTPYQVPEGLVSWLDLIAAAPGTEITQRDSGMVATWARFEEDPAATSWRRIGTGSWSLHGAESLDVTGRLIGGCIETVSVLAGTPYGDVTAFGRDHADEGLIVYLEASDDDAYTICRELHAIRLAGWFEHARAILIGRTSASDSDTLTQREAVLDALGMLGLPIVLDAEIGHVPPHLPLVNGAAARLVVDGERREIVQSIG